jgi:hypothetical protein
LKLPVFVSSDGSGQRCGLVHGLLSSGRIRVRNGFVTSGFRRPWFGPLPFAVGLFALFLFAFLAAVYLTVEAEDEALRDDFRRRALGAAGAVGVLALKARNSVVKSSRLRQKTKSLGFLW